MMRTGRAGNGASAADTLTAAADNSNMSARAKLCMRVSLHSWRRGIAQLFSMTHPSLTLVLSGVVRTMVRFVSAGPQPAREAE